MEEIRQNSESKIYGREKEKQLLDKILNSDKAEFTVVYGRRRIGKTFLIQQYFQEKGVYFELTGTNNAPMQNQLGNFSQEIARVFYQGKPQEAPKSWSSAFNQLLTQLQKVPADKPIILFFDELPWLATSRSYFLQSLEHLWNRHLSRMPNVKLIVCGSAASWMIKKIINNKGGLHGRATQIIHLKPFTLGQTKDFLACQHVQLSNKDLVDLYLAIGGVAKYLTYVERGFSSAQIINKLCFDEHAPLKDEFNRLYHSLFKNAGHHLAIVKVLAKSHYGLPKNEILKKSKLPSGGQSSSILEELEHAGFIMKMPFFGHKAKMNRYRLADEYSLFYLRWLDTAQEIDNTPSNFWLKQSTSQNFKVWSGLAFETLCLKHIKEIKAALGIESVITRSSTYYDNNCQIDGILDREDNAINLFEIKYTSHKVPTNKAFADKLNQRRAHFASASKTRKTLINTLITNEVPDANMHFTASVDTLVLIEQLLDQ